MKRRTRCLYGLLLAGNLAACNDPQQKDTTITTPADTMAPAVVQPDSDSDKYKMPVEKTDTTQNAEMPVAKPDPHIQPK